MPFQFSIATPPVYNLRLTDVLGNLDLTTGLKVALDASDIASWPGSGQKWLDRSGGGFDFFRGADNTATTDDPTFNGVAGRLSGDEYWSFDGGDNFTYDTTTEGWMDAIHKNDAKFTLAAWGNLGTTANPLQVCGNRVTGGTGFAFFITAVSLRLNVKNTGSDVFDASADLPGLSVISGNLLSADEPLFCAVSVDEAAGTCVRRVYQNGVSYSDSLACTYATPAAGAASSTLGLGCSAPATGTKSSAGSRLYQVAMWQDFALSASQIESLYQNTRSKFGV